VNLLLIFCKPALAGGVKTRLAREVGTETAVAVYQTLCEKTRKIAQEWGGTVAVFHASPWEESTPWKELGPHQQLQKGSDLGSRMAQAFQWGFEQGYNRIVIIGSDLWTLTADDLNQAFASLNQHSVVWGPATDGGYYLLGLSQYRPELFSDLPWSHEDLWHLSQKRVPKEEQHSLRVQNDIDTLEDVLANAELKHLFRRHLP